MKFRSLTAIGLGACLVACVTVNVYFPEAAAERAADLFIQDVYGKGESGDGAAAPATETALRKRGRWHGRDRPDHAARCLARTAAGA